MNVLVINCGSSSVKFCVFDVSQQLSLVAGVVDGIGLDSCLFKQDSGSERVFVKSHKEALSLILDKVKGYDIRAVGHRFVHGGLKYRDSVVVSPSILKELEALEGLAPLHNPHNLAGIKACTDLLSVPQVVVFDTSFFKDLPLRASSYALPKSLSSKFNLTKFGFHGISHKFLAREARELLGREAVNVITCHLGNGASVSCVKHNVCIDTSMGFTPLQGLVMGSRSGDVDPGLLLHLIRDCGFSVDDVDNILNKESGLKGLCGDSDMRKVYSRVVSGDDDAVLALDVFCYRVVHYVSAYLGVMKADTHAIVFSAGIGEGGFYVRKKVCDSLKHLGVVINYDKNMINKGLITEPSVISDSSSKIKVLVIPSNEELMIAQEVADLLK